VTWLLVGATVILFASFTSTLVVRRAESDWRVGPVPPLLWVNTAVLLASSAAMEWARAGGRAGRLDRVRTGLGITTALGTAFLAGQWGAWRQLTAAGVSMAAGPHSAFFYLLTGTHALHVVGGIGALCYALVRARRALVAASAARVATPVAIYWHFVDVLWLYVFALLFVL
jgi:cytochrome c oxidase subunit 3